ASRRMRPSATPSGDVRTFSPDGTNLFHLVALDGGGYVAVSAIDSPYPILGFSGSGELPDENPANPFWTLVGGAARRAAAASASSAIQSDGDIDDLRVPPMIETTWNQQYVGDKTTYNYYTPDEDYCGCVATAMAQLMRFHKFPTAEIEPQTFTCYTNGVAVKLTMKGGTYDWDAMPLSPNSSISDTQREAIGRICYDAGVAVRMNYTTNGSEAATLLAIDPIKSVFGYSSAESYELLTGTLSQGEMENAILSNLDAGYPVILGIYEGKAGHAVLADGYGYLDGVLYCHLNMGWGGSWDYWYPIPEVEAGKYTFTELGTVVYNIFPDREGTLVTGRVIDPDGEPVAGASVTAGIRYMESEDADTYTTITTNVTTSATGHYAIFAPGVGTIRATPTATCGQYESTNVVTAVARTCSSPFDIDFDAGEYYAAAGGLSIGNSWGNDLYLKLNGAAAAAFTSFTVADGGGFMLSFTGTAGAEYRLEYTLSLAEQDWRPYTNAVVPASGTAALVVPAIPGATSVFFKLTAD
ncbi:MAG: C10 family peptidase, partial [Kiritimatiellae bacterium]|nr:C10 family peptidase [Kiritimatiellia bacterium]